MLWSLEKISWKLSKTEMESAQNVLSNAVIPIDIRRDGQLIGTAEYVAAEVLVSKVIRSVLKMENRNILDLAFVHVLSIPFLGGLAAPFGDQASISDASAGYTKALTDGAKGIPAVLAAQWVLATASKGFHFPWFTMKDLLITAGSKAITRPLVYSIVDKIGGMGQEGFMVMDQIFSNQVANSNLKYK